MNLLKKKIKVISVILNFVFKEKVHEYKCNKINCISYEYNCNGIDYIALKHMGQMLYYSIGYTRITNSMRNTLLL